MDLRTLCAISGTVARTLPLLLLSTALAWRLPWIPGALALAAAALAAANTSPKANPQRAAVT